ncbi:F-box domain-containing protein [Mycena kentingensis (nom. inval.)]|nr:F-box domain-containing protein [Mycena kentingensis (nom. inval.)]
MMTDTLCSKCGNSAFIASSLLPSASETAHLAALLRSNLPPTDPVSVADAKLDEGLLDLARYDKEIQRMESVLIALKRDRCRLQDHLEYIKSAHHSPIRLVPNEILAEILYESVLPRSWDSDGAALERHQNSWLDGRQAFSTLLKICYRWYGVVVGTPKLWAQISFTFASPYYYQRDIDLSLVSHSLRASGSHPLSICITQSRTMYLNDSLQALFTDLILPHVPRIRHFSGDLSSLLCVRHNLETLEDLELRLADYQPFEKTGWVVPQLKHVSLRWRSCWHPLPELPWTQLSSFSYITATTFHSREVISLPWGTLAPGASFTLFTAGFYHWNTPVASDIAELTCSISAPGIWPARDLTSLVQQPHCTPSPHPPHPLSGKQPSHLTLEVFLLEDELLAALASLPALETLALRNLPEALICAAHPVNGNGPLHVPALITDDLLRRLHLSRLPDPFDDVQPIPEPKLIPNLRVPRSPARFPRASSSAKRQYESSSPAIPPAHHPCRYPPRRNTLEDPAFWETVQGWMDAGKLDMTYRAIRADAYIREDPDDIMNLDQT